MKALLTILGLFALCAATLGARQADVQALAEFQRAADRYAFQHRQVERRLGGDPDREAISRGMRVTRPTAQEGALFSPLAGAAIRARLSKAMQAPKCEPPSPNADFRVHRVNEQATGAAPLPACLLAVLPKLPEELAYRSAGVALLLVDVHADLVIDVLHGALPAK